MRFVRKLSLASAALASFSLLAPTAPARADLIGYWDFGSATTGTPAFPIAAAQGAGSLTFTGNATNTAFFGGTSVGAYNGAANGGALAIQNGTNGVNNGSSLDFHVNLSLFQDVMLTYAAQRTATGFTSETWSYSNDNGATFSAATAITSIPTSFALQTVDFSAFNTLDGAANSIFRVTFAGGTTTSASGNNRLDNFNFQGTAFQAAGAQTLTWNPSAGGATWNTTTTNWLDPSSVAKAFHTGDTVHFTDAGLAAGSTVTIAAGGVAPASTYVENTSGTYTITGAGITAGNLIKNNAGTLVLSSANTYNGGTTINGGTVSIASDAALGAAAGSVALAGGTLKITAPLTSARSVSAGIGSTSTLDIGANAVTLAGISGSGDLIKAGAGTLSLPGGSVTTGLQIAAGKVVLNETANTGVGASQTATGTWVGDLEVNGAFRTDFGTGDYSGGGLIKFNSGGTTAALTTVTGSNAHPVIGNNIQLAGPTFNIFPTSTGVVTINGVISGPSDLNFAIGDAGIQNGGAGVLILGGHNTYTGKTTFNSSTSGITRNAIDNALPTTTDVLFNTSNLASSGIGKYDLGGFNQTIASLATGTGTAMGSNPGTIVNSGASLSTLTVNGASSTTYAGAINDTASAIALTKAGAGTLTLSGTSAYTGPTAVNGGTLNVTGTLGSTAVAVSGATSVLAGTGTIGGTVDVGMGGTLAAGGIGTVGAFSLSGLNLNSGSVLNFDLGATGIGDVVTAGSLNLVGPTTLNIVDAGSFGVGTYPLFNYIAESGAVSSISLGTTPAGFSYALQDMSSQIQLVVSTVGGGTSNWTNTGSGDYLTASNWSAGVPNSATASANFGSAITGPATVNVASPVQVHSVTLANANSYTVSGAGPVTLAGANATVTVNQGAQSITAPITVASSATLATTGTGTLKTGVVSGGAVTVAQNSNVTATQFVGSSSLTVAGSAGNDTGKLTLAASSPTFPAVPAGSDAAASTVDSLVIPHSGGTYYGTLDIANNDIIVKNGNLADITAAIASGINGFAWDGKGISSSAAADTSNPSFAGYTAIAVLYNDDDLTPGVAPDTTGGPFTTSFDGKTLVGNEVLVKYTYYGDANLDGVVDFVDYGFIDAGIAGAPASWAYGDFNYDGVVDFIDYGFIDAGVAGYGQFGQVPEPSTLLLASMGALAFGGMAWRRRASARRRVVKA